MTTTLMFKLIFRLTIAIILKRLLTEVLFKQKLHEEIKIETNPKFKKKQNVDNQKEGHSQPVSHQNAPKKPNFHDDGIEILENKSHQTQSLINTPCLDQIIKDFKKPNFVQNKQQFANPFEIKERKTEVDFMEMSDKKEKKTSIGFEDPFKTKSNNPFEDF